MKRKLLIPALLVTLALTLAACQTEETSATSPDQPQDQTNTPTQPAQEETPDQQQQDTTNQQRGNTEPSQTADAQTADTVVEMRNTQYQPSTISVDRGDTIKFVNRDSYPHTVTINALGIDKQVSGGESVFVTIDQSGTFDLQCTIHPSMTGTISTENTTTTQTDQQTTDTTEDSGNGTEGYDYDY